MSDVVFFSPNISGDLSEECMGVLLLATILKNQGIDCSVVPFCDIGDPNNLDAFLESAMQIVAELNPKIISFYTRCDIFHIDLKLAELIKSTYKDIYIVFGGPQSDIVANTIAEEIPYVDYICQGEGETTIYPLFSSLLSGNPDKTVPGLVYNQNGIIHKNPRPALIENLDNIPFIDYSFLGKKTLSSIKPNSLFRIDIGRGCPFSCTYCTTKTFWGRKFRLKSPERIVQEIKYIHEQFGVSAFGFSHDMFTFDRNKVLEICKLLKNLEFPIRWTCSARLDFLDFEMIDTMVDSGLRGFFVGVETGSPRMQKLIHKNLNLNKALEIIEYANKKGVFVTASFMYGFPDETEEDVSLSMVMIAEILKLKKISVGNHLCAFLSGTEMTKKYLPYMTPAEQYTSQTRDYSVAECMDLINAHPSMFEHFFEYKTELRSKLRFYDLFFAVWSLVQPVYQHISEYYSSTHIIDMYYDFVKENQETLLKTEHCSWEDRVKAILNNDNLLKKFSNDKFYDIMQDIYRLNLVDLSDEVKNGNTVTDIYCFNPNEIKTVPSIRNYTKCIAIVTTSNKTRKINIAPSFDK